MKTNSIKSHFSYSGIKTLALVGIMAFGSSCEDFVTVPLGGGKIGEEVVFSSDATAESAMLGVYSATYNNASYSILYPMFMADELEGSATNSYVILQQNAYDETQSGWFLQVYYNTIYCANTVIEGCAASTQMSDAKKKQFTGEALFMRAYCHFLLANLYGEVPLVTMSDVRVSSMLPNTSMDKLYEAIITDLKDAYNLVSENYPSTEKVRVNKAACTAMLARAYLYNGDWTLAESEATKVISSGAYQLVSDLTQIFKVGSSEIIWQQWMNGGYLPSTSSLIPSSTTSTAWWALSVLVNAIENGDGRKAAWLALNGDGRYYHCKYKNRSTTTGTAMEYNVQLRLGEMYLIRAEARAHQDKIIGSNSAASDLDMIRSRAGLLGTDATTRPAMLTAIEHERRIEMMAEPFHRWFDLKRTGRAIPVLGALKSQTWHDRAVLLPFPISMLNANIYLKQNDGYDH